MVNLNPLVYINFPANFLTSFLASQFTTLPYPSHDFSGQTIIITGGNTGLGLEAAQHFVRLNARRVILACRSLEKGDVARRAVEESTGKKGVVEVWQVDLLSFVSVEQFCSRVNGLQRLDAVIENAGLATPHVEMVETHESTITVNVISTFLMALLLLPKLRADGQKYNMIPRLSIVASDAHEQVCYLKESLSNGTDLKQASFYEQDAEQIFEIMKDGTKQSDRYNVSKLLEILIVRELAPAMTASAKPQVILNTLTPGFCRSELMRHAVFPLNFLAWIGKNTIARTTEMGSRTLVAAVAAGEDSHGVYMEDSKNGKVSQWVSSSKGAQVQKRVYTELLNIMEGIHPGITENI